MEKLQMFDALGYAGIAQQVEVTEATVSVYFDQLHSFDVIDVNLAIRQWVSEYSDPYRRLPTIGEIKAIVFRRKPRPKSPDLERDLYIARLVKSARDEGKTQQQIDQIIDRFSKQLLP